MWYSPKRSLCVSNQCITIGRVGRFTSFLEHCVVLFKQTHQSQSYLAGTMTSHIAVLVPWECGGYSGKRFLKTVKPNCIHVYTWDRDRLVG